MSKVLTFKKKDPQQPGVPEDIVDHGTLGNLNYEVYKRGVIHIFNETAKFKKDVNLFEEAFLKLDFKSLEEGKELVIPGSGDNDDLIFFLKDGDIQIDLKTKEFGIVKKLKDILKPHLKK